MKNKIWNKIKKSKVVENFVNTSLINKKNKE